MRDDPHGLTWPWPPGTLSIPPRCCHPYCHFPAGTNCWQQYSSGLCDHQIDVSWFSCDRCMPPGQLLLSAAQTAKDSLQKQVIHGCDLATPKLIHPPFRFNRTFTEARQIVNLKGWSRLSLSRLQQRRQVCLTLQLASTPLLEMQVLTQRSERLSLLEE